jgi:hypothetical protein
MFNKFYFFQYINFLNITICIYQFLFHFGPPLPGILTRPHVMLRPFVMSNDTERLIKQMFMTR